MQQFYYFSEVFYSETAEIDLDIFYGDVEHEPENGIFFEFNWEALDESGRDCKDEMSDKEHAKVEKKIRDYLKSLPSLADYD